MALRSEKYVKALGEGARQRLELTRDGKRIVDYVVQLEVETNNEIWQPAVRYDTKHGGPHRDQLKITGEAKKEMLNAMFDILTGYRDAVAAAERDIAVHWETYRRRFLEGKWPVP